MQNETVDPDVARLQQCSQFNTILFNDFGMVIYAVVAMVIICCLEKRRYKADVCRGRPGLPLPINFLDGTSNSVANAAAVGCTLQHVFIYLLTGPVKLTSMAILTVVLFARNYVCTTENWVWSLYIVSMISEGYLLILFIYRCVTALFKKSVNSKEPLVKIDQIMHVMELLRTPVSSSTSGNIKQVMIKTTEKAVYEAKLCCLHKSLYRCTTRTLTINTIVFMIFYYYFVSTVVLAGYLSDLIDQIPGNNTTSNQLLLKIYRYSKTLCQVIKVSLYIANILSAVYLVANMIFIYQSQRQHIIKIWKGDRSFIPVNCTQSHSDMLVKNLMYAGNQVSHLLEGYVVFQLVVFLLCVVIAYGIVLPIMKEFPDFLFKVFAFSIPGLVFMFVFRFALRIISQKVFLQNHYISSDNGKKWEKVLALDNRRVYQNLSFFLFFYYILIGLYRCVYRVITSVVLSVFYISRMDKPLLFPGFEHFDIGYMTYLGFLEVELHHCHPVVVVFCDQIIKTVQSKSFTSQQRRIETDVYENGVYTCYNLYTTRVRNKWLKMRTLIKNQSLCKDSKNNIAFEHPLHAKKAFVGSKDKIKSTEV